MPTTFDDAVRAHRAGDWERAAELYAAAMPVEPWKAAHNLGVLCSALGRLPEAEAALRQALGVRPGLAEAAYSLAHVLLAQGRYPEGWPLYEARRELPRLKIPAKPAALPEWTGGDLAGARLVVVGEQGFGDQIMLARFLPELRRRGAEVVYACRPELNRLFEGSIPREADVTRTGADLWALGGSLPFRLGVALETLAPPADLGLRTSSGGGIGVAVRGRPTHANDAHRSLGEAEAARLLRLGRDLSPEATGAKDFLETARTVAGLDLVISVDSAIAHLAATLGKPTWILLPAFQTDWRWMRGRADTPWYPSARLIRQPAPGDWETVLTQVEAELAG